MQSIASGLRGDKKTKPTVGRVKVSRKMTGKVFSRPTFSSWQSGERENRVAQPAEVARPTQ